MGFLFVFIQMQHKNQQAAYWVLNLARTPIFATKRQFEIRVIAKSKGDIVRYPSYPCQQETLVSIV